MLGPFARLLLQQGPTCSQITDSDCYGAALPPLRAGIARHACFARPLHTLCTLSGYTLRRQGVRTGAPHGSGPGADGALTAAVDVLPGWRGVSGLTTSARGADAVVTAVMDIHLWPVFLGTERSVVRCLDVARLTSLLARQIADHADSA